MTTLNEFSAIKGVNRALRYFKDGEASPAEALLEKWDARKGEGEDPVSELYGFCLALKRCRDAGINAGFGVREIDAILNGRPAGPEQSEAEQESQPEEPVTLRIFKGPDESDDG